MSELHNFRQVTEEVERKEALKTQRPVNELFEKAVDYTTNRLANRSASYTLYMAGNLLRSRNKFDASMSQKSWNGKDRAGVLNFLESFRHACNNGGVHEGFGMMIFQYYVK